MNYVLTNGHGPQIGDRCPRDSCDGVLGVYSTRIVETAGVRIRYLSCNVCGCRPEANQQVVPLRYSPPRRASSR